MKKIFSFMLMATALLISGVMLAGNVAKVVETGNEYTSLSAAISSATSGQTVQLLDNCSAYNIQIPQGKQLTLDLDKYTITSNASSTYAVICVQGDLTINAAKRDYVDEDGNPQVEWLGGINGGNYYAIGFDYYYSAVNGSKLTINGGKFSVNTRNNAGMNNAIIQCPSSNSQTIVINDGEFVGSGHANFGSIIYVPVSSSPKRDITINGGRFYNEITGYNGGNRCLILLQGTTADLKITGGDFEIKYTAGGYQFVSCIDVRGTNNNVTITGGSFVNSTPKEKMGSNISYFAAMMNYQDVKSISLSNAKFKSGGPAVWMSSKNANITKGISNVSFESEASYALKISSFASEQNYVIDGGQFLGYNGIHIYGSNAANVEIQNCDVKVSNIGIDLQNTQNLTINNGSIVAGTTGVKTTSTGTLTINGNTQITGTSGYGVYSDNGNVNVTSGRIWGKTNSVFNVKYLECAGLQGTVEVTGGVFNNRPVPEGYQVREETTASTPRRATMEPPYPQPQPQPQPQPEPEPCNKTAQSGNATILGVGLDVIDNPDQTTLAMGYLYSVGRPEGADIIASTEPGATNDWATNTTWTDGETNVIPTVSDNVEIPAGKNVIVGESKHTDAVAYGLLNLGDLTIKKGNSLNIAQILKVQNEAQQGGELGKVTVEPGARLTVGNAQDVDELNIILKDDGENGTGVMLFSPEANVENVYATIELHTTAHKDNEGNYFWNYIGIPLKTDNFTAANWEKVPVTEGQATSSYLQTWDFTEGWVNSGLEAFKPFQGVAITNDSKDGVIYRFKGTMVGNADKYMQFKPRGYNFFANSYTAPIDIETLLNELKDNGVVDAVVYMFDTENNRFQSVALSAFAGFIPPYFRVIPSMNGFFILNQQTQASSQTMDYGDAVYNCALGNRPIYAPAREANDFTRVHINVETNGSKDGLYLIENEEFTSEFENGYDVIKYMTPGQSNIYVQTAQGEQSNLFNSNIEGTMIGFEAATNQTTYTLSFDELQGETFVLTDMITGTSVEINENNTYTFTAQAGQRNDSRFMISRAKKTPTDMDNVECNVKARGIYSIMGHYFGNVTEWKNLPSGVYVVNGVKVVK